MALSTKSVELNDYQKKAVHEMLHYYHECLKGKKIPIINICIMVAHGKHIIIESFLKEILKEFSNARHIYIIEENTILKNLWNSCFANGDTQKVTSYSINESCIEKLDVAEGDLAIIFSSLKGIKKRLKLAKKFLDSNVSIISISSEPIEGVSKDIEPTVIPMPYNREIFDYRDISAASSDVQANLKQELKRQIISCLGTMHDAPSVEKVHNSTFMKQSNQQLINQIIELRKKLEDKEEKYGKI